MATISPKMVKEIINTSLSDDEIEGAISSASVLYRTKLGASALPEDVSIEIQRYIAAHLVSYRDPSTRTVTERIGDASVEYEQKGTKDYNNSLGSTRWGQMAITFDPTGILYRLGRMPAVWYSL